MQNISWWIINEWDKEKNESYCIRINTHRMNRLIQLALPILIISDFRSTWISFGFDSKIFHLIPFLRGWGMTVGWNKISFVIPYSRKSLELETNIFSFSRMSAEKRLRGSRVDWNSGRRSNHLWFGRSWRRFVKSDFSSITVISRPGKDSLALILLGKKCCFLAKPYFEFTARKQNIFPRHYLYALYARDFFNPPSNSARNL